VLHVLICPKLEDSDGLLVVIHLPQGLQGRLLPLAALAALAEKVAASLPELGGAGALLSDAPVPLLGAVSLLGATVPLPPCASTRANVIAAMATKQEMVEKRFMLVLLKRWAGYSR
jgi:hypothetical protein